MGVEAGAAADVLLVVSELASNAVRHARTEFRVTACRQGDSFG